jgi:UDP-N-acetylmuramate-alanine ligase
MGFPYRKVHMVGIGGAGMSAIAEALLAEGVTVTGSDLEASSYTERLRQKGATVLSGTRRRIWAKLKPSSSAAPFPLTIPKWRKRADGICLFCIVPTP